MGLSAGRDDPAVFLRPQVARVSLWAVLGLWLGRRLGRLLVVVVRSPSAMTGIGLAGAFVAGWHFIDPGLPLGLLGGLVLGLVVWRRRWPASFETHAYPRARSWWRSGLVYRRRWAAAMDTAGLTVERHTRPPGKDGRYDPRSSGLALIVARTSIRGWRPLDGMGDARLQHGRETCFDGPRIHSEPGRCAHSGRTR